MNREELDFYRQWSNLSTSPFSCSSDFHDLKLKTVVRERHGEPVLTVKFNESSEEYFNLVATVGGNQATVYDDSYLGNYINVVLQFTNEQTSETEGGKLSCCAWLNDTDKKLPYLVVAGEDPNLSIISIASSRVISLLKGHDHNVVQLEALQLDKKDSLVGSLDETGLLRVWDIFQETCLLTTEQNISFMMWSPVKQSMMVVSKDQHLTALSFHKKNEQLEAQTNHIAVFQESQHETILRLLHLNNEFYAVQGSSGWITVVPYIQAQALDYIKIPPVGCGPPLAWCRPLNGKYLCLVDDSGDIHIINSQDGKTVSTLSLPSRLSSPVQSCSLSPNQMNLILAVGNGYLCRYQQTKPSLTS